MYLGKRVRVRVDSKTVRIYLATELIKLGGLFTHFLTSMLE